ERSPELATEDQDCPHGIIQFAAGDFASSNFKSSPQGQHLGLSVPHSRGAIGNLFKEEQGLERLLAFVGMVGPRLQGTPLAVLDSEGALVKLTTGLCRNDREGHMT